MNGNLLQFALISQTLFEIFDISHSFLYDLAFCLLMNCQLFSQICYSRILLRDIAKLVKEKSHRGVTLHNYPFFKFIRLIR